MNNSVVITVPGKAVTQGNMTAFNIGGKIRVTHKNNPELKEYRERIFWSAKAAGVRTPFTDLVHIDATFVLARPASHYKNRKRSNPLREDAPKHPLKPDIDKLLRGLFDALTGCVWQDDKQVGFVSARRIYGEPEVQIVVTELSGEDSLERIEKNLANT